MSDPASLLSATDSLNDLERGAAQVAAELALPERGVRAVLKLMGDGATVPFLARYRKEATGGLDEQHIRSIGQRYEYLRELWERQRTILRTLQEQGVLEPELERKLAAATSKSELEDLYAPHKPKRRTRASMAKERGLLPLAELMWQGAGPVDAPSQYVQAQAQRFVDKARDVVDVASALAGARDICAERLSDDAEVRKRARELLATAGVMTVCKTKAFRKTETKFDAYAEYQEPLARLPGHRMLAIHRGRAEGVLKVSVSVPRPQFEQWVLARTEAGRKRRNSPWLDELRVMVADAVERLIIPRAENEVETAALGRAHGEAIAVFAKNLRQLLLAPPLGGKRVLGIDPGQRTGCKCAALSETGALVEHSLFNLVQGPKAQEQAAREVKRLMARHRIEAVAVGNGTHGRETERFVRDVLRADAGANPAGAFVVSVNEAGASVYSASDSARAEFPDHDITVRGAVSIGRRLQDPLAELVKVEPRSIGVGQYQHDVDQRELARALTDVVESCVNEVGVEVNTASAELLSYVAGVGKKLAQAILAHRNKHGPFSSRQQLLRVKGMGPKSFEQCAGFLRIRSAENPLDATAVHPERYDLVVRMAHAAGCSVRDLIGDQTRLSRIRPDEYRSDEVGTYTLSDILAELAKPGRDPRAEFEPPRFKEEVSEIGHLTPNMMLEGVVTNVTAFGAFVDVGVHQDGLVHVSELADRFVKDPASVVSVGQKIQVRVLAVDMARKRISLSARRQGA